MGTMARRLKWLAIAVAVFGLASLLSLWSYGRFARHAQGAPGHALAVAADATPLDRRIAPALLAHPGHSGMALVQDNLDAYAVRSLSARSAGRSLDLQYYIWHDDFTGRLLDYELLRAADRGVRVRLLLDDLNAHGRNSILAALDAHPGIEVRMFNPTRNRAGTIARSVEMLLRMFSVNRRMHNKAWIADGRVAVVGGRNIGDEYFSAAADTNFVDLDALVVGPAVAQAEAIFDDFWNGNAAIPLSALKRAQPGALRELRERAAKAEELVHDHPYIRRVRASTGIGEFVSGAAFHWPDRLQVLSDPADKVEGGDEARWLVHPLANEMLQARKSFHLVSPYFVPGDRGVQALRGLRARDVDVEILTNSLAATDVLAVHSGYAPYRKPLLEAGVELYELRPQGNREASLFGSSGASLHTKAFAVDGETGFVGSFNVDPRSISLNTEMGVLFHDADTAAALERVVHARVGGRHSYRVLLRDGALRWEDAATAPPKEWGHEPETRWWQRAAVRVLEWLPIESQL
jgi:putative cardiolipin synthase